MRRDWTRRGIGVPIAVVLAMTLTGCPWQNELLSTNAAGSDSANGPATRSVSEWALSPDGEKVVFTTAASDLGPVDTNETEDVYVKDLTNGTYTLISLNGSGTDSGNGSSYDPAFSPDGTKILFTSLASDLGPTDTNEYRDLYVRDLENDTTMLVSVNATGTDSGDGRSREASFGPDSTRVLFTSSANDLGPTDSRRGAGGELDVYIRDLVAGTTTLVSVNAAGTDSGNAGSAQAKFSPDGTKVVFSSNASNLGPLDGSAGLNDVYVRDLVAGTTSLVSENVWGLGGGNGASEGVSFSPDGRKVLFTSTAYDLGPGGSTCWQPGKSGPPIPMPCSNVFIRDLVTGTTSLVSVNIWGVGGGSGASGAPSFSSDGTKVLFGSKAEDLTVPAGDSDELYVRDLVRNRTIMVTVNADGTGGTNGLIQEASFDPSGTRVVFSTLARDNGLADNNGTWDVYVRDLVFDTTHAVSINHERTATGNGESRVGRFTHDGKHVLFWSTASDLVATDTNGHPDLFLASHYTPPSAES